MQPGFPWTPGRYDEIDHCIVRNAWTNTVADVQTEQNTNVSTDHLTMVTIIRQKPKANEKKELETNLKKTLTSDQTPTNKITSTRALSDITNGYTKS